MSNEFIRLLPFLLIPPFLGALIGYVTNAIAIKMLFRPLAEKHVLGIRIPFTPGIIPKQRHELAHSIGRMVSRQLLSPDAVRQQTHNEEFIGNLNKSISAFTEGFLYKPVAGLLSSSHLPDTGRDVFFKLLESFAASPKAKTLLAKLIEQSLLNLLQSNWTEKVFLPKDLDSLVEIFFHSLSDDARIEKLAAYATKWLDKQMDKETQLSLFITDELLDQIVLMIDSFYPTLVDAGVQWLRTEEMSHELEERGKVLLRDILEKLNFFQRVFITAGQFDRTLEENMGTIVKDTIKNLQSSLEKDKNRQGILLALKHELKKLQGLSMLKIEESLSLDLHIVIERLTREGLYLLKNPVIQKQIQTAITENWTSESLHKVQSWLLDILNLEKLGQALASFAFTALQKQIKLWQENDSSNSAVNPFWENLIPAELLAVSPEWKESFDSFVSDSIISIVDAKVSDILDTVDVYALVVNKINSLDVAQVEDLLLTVIKKHLRYINWFGAFLGALIGALQVFTIFFTG